MTSDRGSRTGIPVRSVVKITQPFPTLCYYIVHGILQARILGWVAFPFSRGSSQPRDWTQVSRNAGGFFTSWATREAQRSAEEMINHRSYPIIAAGLIPISVRSWEQWRDPRASWQGSSCVALPEHPEMSTCGVKEKLSASPPSGSLFPRELLSQLSLGGELSDIEASNWDLFKMKFSKRRCGPFGLLTLGRPPCS